MNTHATPDPLNAVPAPRTDPATPERPPAPDAAPRSSAFASPAPDGRHQAEATAARLREVEAALAEARARLEQTREALDAAERRRVIERELARAEAIDLETATLLTEAAIAGMDKADVALAIADLRRRKPFLFRAPARSGAMGPRAGAPDALAAAATTARDSGDRRALLEYLRLRRTA